MYELKIERIMGEDEFIGVYPTYIDALNKAGELRNKLNTYYIGEETISDHCSIKYVG